MARPASAFGRAEVFGSRSVVGVRISKMLSNREDYIGCVPLKRIADHRCFRGRRPRMRFWDFLIDSVSVASFFPGPNVGKLFRDGRLVDCRRRAEHPSLRLSRQIGYGLGSWTDRISILCRLVPSGTGQRPWAQGGTTPPILSLGHSYHQSVRRPEREFGRQSGTIWALTRKRSPKAKKSVFISKSGCETGRSY